MSEYCSNCFCDHCVAQDMRRLEVKRRQDAAAARMERRAIEKFQEAERRRELILREQAFIWFIVNTAQTNEEAMQLMYDLAVVLDYRSNAVNTKRRQYAVEMIHRAEAVYDAPWWRRLRAARALGDPAVHPYTFAKPPGTIGTELPDDED